MAIIWITLCMLALLGFCSLAVDLSHVQTVKTQFELACDAAARAGAANLANGWSAVQSAAYSTALQNTANGAPVTLNSNTNIILLDWPSTTPLSSTQIANANAVEVTGHLSVPLMFTPGLGIFNSTVNTHSVAEVVTNSNNFQVVGVNSFNLSGNNTIDSYNSGNGKYSSQTASSNGTVTTNGSVNVPNGCTIHGDTWSGAAPGGSCGGWGNSWGGGWGSGGDCGGSYGGGYGGGYGYGGYGGNCWSGGCGGGSCTGCAHQLTTPVSYPTPSVPSGCTNLGNISCGSSSTYTLNSGNYCCSGCNCSGNLVINATNGPVNLYCTGTFSCSGKCSNGSYVPNNFHLNMCCANDCDFGCSCCGCINAPASNINMSNGGSIYGCCCGNNVNLGSGSSVHYDEALGNNGGSSNSTTIVQVE